MATERKEVTINLFSGFYETIHGYAFDSHLEYELEYFSDVATDEELDAVQSAFWDSDFEKAYNEYVEQWLSNLSDEIESALGLSISIPEDVLQFADLDSPKYYNFSTDTIYATIAPEHIQMFFDKTDRNELQERATALFTSRSGFISFYNPDVETWGSVETWDHNQLGCLLDAFILQHIAAGKDWYELEMQLSDIPANEILDMGGCYGEEYLKLTNELWERVQAQETALRV